MARGVVCPSSSYGVCRAQEGLLWPSAMSLKISTEATGSVESMAIFLCTAEGEKVLSLPSQIV
jgi:hypothetical protein